MKVRKLDLIPKKQVNELKQGDCFRYPYLPDEIYIFLSTNIIDQVIVTKIGEQHSIKVIPPTTGIIEVELVKLAYKDKELKNEWKEIIKSWW